MSIGAHMAGLPRSGPEERRAYWLMVLPALLVYLLVMAFPTAASLALSVSDYRGGTMFGARAAPWGFSGFGRYARLAAEPQFWVSLKNNAYIILVSVFGQIPLGFAFAYLVYRKLVRAPGFWQGVLYMPAIVSTIVIGSLWGALFSPYGPIADLVNALGRSAFQARLDGLLGPGGASPPTDAALGGILRLAGGQDALAAAGLGSAPAELRDFLSGYGPGQLAALESDLANLLAPRYSALFMDRPDVAMLPVLFVILWQWTGFYLIVFLANMQRIDPQLLEAAQIDGAGEGQTLRRIVLPSQSGVVVTMAIFAISGSLKSFDVIWAMNGDKPATQVLSIFTYRTAFAAAPDYPLANAVSTVMVAVSLVLIVATRLAERRLGGKE
jgi:ABC-type sugar transport system permease subunit